LLSRIFPVVFVGSLLMVAAVPASQDKDQKDEDKIQGVWLPVLMEKGGEKAPEEVYKSAKMIIKEGTITMELQGQADPSKVTYKIDPSKTPKHIDITQSISGQDNLMIGIYLLEGDDLKLCFSKDARPTEWTTKAGDSNGLIVLKREKKKD
jgi:uncharacterized protein (TIGR03067 family)